MWWQSSDKRKLAQGVKHTSPRNYFGFVNCPNAEETARWLNGDETRLAIWQTSRGTERGGGGGSLSPVHKCWAGWLHNRGMIIQRRNGALIGFISTRPAQSFMSHRYSILNSTDLSVKVTYITRGSGYCLRNSTGNYWFRIFVIPLLHPSHTFIAIPLTFLKLAKQITSIPPRWHSCIMCK
jgi:hypothetical protein